MRKWIWIALGILCVFYSISIFLLRSGSKFYLVWTGLGAGFFFLAWEAQIQLWSRIPGVVRALFIAAVLLGAGTLAAAEICVLKHFRDRADPGLDVIVVLGAQVWADGPSPSLLYRLETARRYLEASPGTRCIVSGGQGSNEPWSEAQGMRDYLTGHGIPEERILMEDASTNTVENIRFSMKLCDPGEDRIGIVTNDFHVFRGLAVAGTQGMRDIRGIAAPSHPWYLLNNMFREYFGIAKDLIYGNMRV